MQKKIVDVNELHVEDVPFVGGKGANLGELTNAGFPVPEAFVLTTVAYDYFIDSSKIFDAINKEIAKIDSDTVIVKRIQEKFAGIQEDVKELTIGGVLVLENGLPADLYKNVIRKHLENSKRAEMLLDKEKARLLHDLAEFKTGLGRS